MTVDVNIRTTANPTVVADTAVAAVSPTFDRPLTGVGHGEVRLEVGTYDDPNLAAADAQGRLKIVELDFGTSQVGFLAEKRRREWTPSGSREIVSGRSVKAILEDAKVEAPRINDDLQDDVLRLGFMHPEFSDLSWPYALSFGSYLDQPFDTPRPEGAADLSAGYISFTLDPHGETVWGARKTFTVDEDGYYVFQATSDDNYELFIDGIALLKSPSGPFQWENKQEIAVPLPAGTYTLAVRVRNLDRLATGSNITWFWMSMMPAAGDGAPLAKNQLWHIDTTATSGTWTLTVVGHGSTPGLDVNISAANLQSALEAIVGAGNVSVSGSGSPARNHEVSIYNDADAGTFQIGVDGQYSNNIAYNASAATVKAAVEELPNVTTCTVTGSGTSGDPWVITITNPARTSFTVDTNDSLTQAGSPVNSSVSVVHQGTEPDPWAIEFIGALAYQRVMLEGDGSTLTPAGALTVSDVVPAQAADAIVHTDETWKAVEFTEATHWRMTYGEVWRILLEQAQATGHLPQVTRDGFGDDSDNDGAPWDYVEIAIPVGQSLLDCANTLDGHGVETDVTPQLGLRAWQSRGTDRTATVTIDGALPFLRRSAESHERTVNRAMIRIPGGWTSAEHSSLGAGDERRTEQFTIGTADTETTTEIPVGEWLDEQATPRRDITIQWPTNDDTAGFDPLDDFDVGDLITGPGWDGNPATLRVLHIGQKQLENSGRNVWSILAAVV